MSDLHGRHDLFLEMLDRISFSERDSLYILGDVADRGEDGVKTWRYIMTRSNITLLAGNHEIMMLDTADRAKSDGMARLYESKEWRLWEYNGGAVTWEALLMLSKDEMNAVLAYVRNSCLIIPDLNVKGRDFYLCHSTHADSVEKRKVLLKDASKKEIQHVVWDRVYPIDNGDTPAKDTSKEGYDELYANYPKKMKLIFGHTPTSFITSPGSDGRCRIWHGGHGHLIDIDCGCAAFRPEQAMLGCLRLDDLKEYYVNGHKKRRRIVKDDRAVKLK